MAFTVTGAMTVSNATPKIGQPVTATFTVTDSGNTSDVHITSVKMMPLSGSVLTIANIGEVQVSKSYAGAGLQSTTSGTLTCASVIATNTVTVNGVVLTGVATGGTVLSNQFDVGASDTACGVNLAAAVRAALPDSRFNVAATGGVVTITSPTASPINISATGGTVTASAITTTTPSTSGDPILKSSATTGVYTATVILNAAGAISLGAVAEGTRDDTGAAFSVPATAGVTITAS